MKKTYVKPEIVFENFSLTQNIAGGCEGIVDNPSKGNCAVIGSGNQFIFDGSIGQCEFSPEELNGESDKWNGFCYHVPTEYNNLFNS